MNETSSSHGACERPPQTNPPGRRRRGVWRWVLGLLVVGLFAVWIGLIPPLPIGPVHFSRDKDGWSEQAENGRGQGLQGELHLGGVKSQDNLCSSSSESRPGNARFACRRVAVVNRSDHLLLQRAGRWAVEELKSLKDIQHIDYFPHGGRPKPGEMAPDVNVTIELLDLEESSLVGSKLHARIQMAMSNTLNHSRCSYFDDFCPPEVCFVFNATLDHRSTTMGVGTRSSRYKLAGEDVGKQLGTALVKKLKELIEKDQPMPELPAAFYPAYRQPPQVPLPPGESADLLASYHGLMRANETLWRLQTARPAAQVLTELKKRLENDGWKTGRLELKEDSLMNLRATKGEDVFTIYPEERPEVFSPGEMVVTLGKTEPAAAEPPRQTVVLLHYVDRMNQKELAAAIDGLLDSDCPVGTLTVVERLVRGKQRRRLIQRLERAATKSPSEWLLLAEFYKSEKRDDAARDALTRTVLLLRTVGNQGDLQGRIDELAKKLGVKEPRNLKPTRELLRQCGFVELTAGAPIADRELRVDEPALFYAYTGKGQLKTVALRVIESASTKDGKTYGLAHVEECDGGRAGGSASPLISYTTSIDGLGTAMFDVRQIGDEPRFRLSTRILEDKRAAN